MVKAKSNYENAHNDITCDYCQVDKTTEHLLECEKYRSIKGFKLEKSVIKSNNMNKLSQAAKRITWIEEYNKTSAEK